MLNTNTFLLSGPANTGAVTAGTGGTKVFAGPRDDPFVFDLVFVFRALGFQPGGPLTTRPPGVDFFAGVDCSIWALELPPAKLTAPGKGNIIKLADQAVRLAPDQAAGHAARGDARLELGRYAEARADFQRAAELTPGLAAESRLAQLRCLEGHPEEAFTRLTKALADAPASEPPATVAQIKLQLGELRFRAGDLAQAEAFYGQARELLPEHPSVLERLAELRGAQGKFSAARELFEGFVRRTDRPEHCQAVGDLLVAAGDANGAVAWHDRALQGYLRAAEAGDTSYDHHLAAFYSDTRRDAAAAVRWARRDLGQRATVFTQDALAWALHHHGEREEALRFLTLALAWGTQDANLFFHAAMIHLAGGDKAAGQKFLARAAATNPLYRAYHFHR